MAVQILKATQIANWFIERAELEGEALTNLKLQKLLHIANGWHLHFTGGEPLFSEDVEAWTYGPVIPVVYHAFKSFGAGGLGKIGNPPQLTGTARQILDSVWNSYGKIPAVTLVGMTHKPGTPWDKVFQNGEGKGMVIPNASIKTHYDELANRSHVVR